MTDHTEKPVTSKSAIKGELIVECPHCFTRVIPTVDKLCPACRNDISDTSDVDPDMVSLTVRESDELPPYCYLCNSYTERYVHLEGEKESSLGNILRVLGSILVPFRVRQTDVGTTNVFIDLPQCEACAEREEPSPVYVDYDEQSMTFIVHRGFRERIQPMPVEDEMPDSDEVDGEANVE